MENFMKKTPSYVEKAQADYREKRDNVQLHLHKGLKERMRSVGIANMSAYVSELIIADLEKREKNL
jgi:hypothetical protein